MITRGSPFKVSNAGLVFQGSGRDVKQLILVGQEMNFLLTRSDHVRSTVSSLPDKSPAFLSFSQVYTLYTTYRTEPGLNSTPVSPQDYSAQLVYRLHHLESSFFLLLRLDFFSPVAIIAKSGRANFYDTFIIVFLPLGFRALYTYI